MAGQICCADEGLQLVFRGRRSRVKGLRCRGMGFRGLGFRGVKVLQFGFGSLAKSGSQAFVKGTFGKPLTLKTPQATWNLRRFRMETESSGCWNSTRLILWIPRPYRYCPEAL